MCNDRAQFVDFKELSNTQEVTLGDGHTLNGTGIGTVWIETLLPDGKSRKCRLEKVHTTKFSGTGCEILDRKKKVTAFATKVGSLYYLVYCRKEEANATNDNNKERLWHRRYGHVGKTNLRKLTKLKMVEKFDYDAQKQIGFCESCIGGKIHRNPFEQSRRRTTEPLELVHSDVCGKIDEKSRGGAEYFLTFVDHHSRYAWVYPLRTKDEVFM